jgi:N-acetylmuramoyl-L-alanine amidase
MHPEGRTHRSAKQYAYWVVPALMLALTLFGCTASPTTRQVIAPLRASAPVPPVTTYRLKDIRSASRPDMTQVSITMSGPGQPLVQRLSPPDRLVIDLPETRLPPQWTQYNVPVSDGRLHMIQVTQSHSKRVQITLGLQAIKDYRVVVQSAPHRVTVELLGTVPTVSSSVKTAQKSVPRASPAALSAQGALVPRAHRMPLICIDPGHGGHDPGALGPTGLAEKTVVLQVAKELRQLIRQAMPQYRVLLTRDQDVFVPLLERAGIANERQAQVFISIHTNSSPRREASGIETWYVSFAASGRAKKIAARENMMSEQQLSTLELILRDLHETDRINQSAVLAQNTQNALAEHMEAHYAGVIPRGVEGAPFVVLHRTTMPSVLVETAFISNPKEAARLRTRPYRRALAKGILRGLRQFLLTTVVATHTH